MVSFETAMQAGMVAIYERLGKPAVFTDRLGSKIDCTVIVVHDLREYGDSVNVNHDSVILAVRLSEIAEKPRRSEKFQVGPDAYVVDSVIAANEFEYRVLAS